MQQVVPQSFAQQRGRSRLRAVASSLPSIVALGALVLAADFVTGPFIQFPLLFLAPVVLASWFHGRRWGLAHAVALTALHASITIVHRPPWSMLDTGINALIRLIVLVLIAVLVHEAAQRKRLSQEVRVLRGLLPICSFCHRIRNGDGCWEVLERYIAERSEAEFTHDVCASCAQKHYGIRLQE